MFLFTIGKNLPTFLANLTPPPPINDDMYIVHPPPRIMTTFSLPHVDQILGQGDGLAVTGDGDGSVHVGWRVPVLTVRDPHHRPRQLSAGRIKGTGYR